MHFLGRCFLYPAMRYKLGVAAQAKCKEKIKQFAECCSDKTFTVVFACRDQLNEMNACLKHWCVLPFHHVSFAARIAMGFEKRAGPPEPPVSSTDVNSCPACSSALRSSIPGRSQRPVRLFGVTSDDRVFDVC